MPSWRRNLRFAFLVVFSSGVRYPGGMVLLDRLDRRNPAMPWQLQEAKQRFSQLIRRAIAEGPQVVTLRGEEVAVVVSAAEFGRLTGRVPDFKEFLLGAPDLRALDIQ